MGSGRPTVNTDNPPPNGSTPSSAPAGESASKIETTSYLPPSPPQITSSTKDPIVTETPSNNDDGSAKNRIAAAVEMAPASVTTAREVIGSRLHEAPVQIQPSEHGLSTVTGEPKTRLTRLSESVSAARGIVTNLIVLIVLLLLVSALIAEVGRQSVVIDPIVLPKDVIDSGWSPDFVSQRLNDKVHAIVEKNSFKYSSSQIEIKRKFVKENGERPDFQVPGSGVSMRTLVHYAKDWLGFTETHFAGNISREGDSLQFILRNSNHETPVATLKERTLDDLLERAAEEIVKWEVPHQLAFYLFFEETEKKDQRKRNNQPEPAGGDYQRTLDTVYYALSRNHPESSSWAYLIWGLVLAEEGKPEEAIKRYEWALALRPGLGVAYGYWGKALSDLQKDQEAIAKFKRAIELDPTDAATQTDWGNTLERGQKHGEAIEHYKKALEYAPKEAVLYNNWCNSLNGLAKHDEAIEKCKQAIALDSNYSKAYHNWGVALERLGRYEEALAEYKQAHAIDPSRPQHCEGWRNALRYLRRDEKTDVEYQKACAPTQ
jgi:tetratricopeptide (TPR) repeat protein